ncbi:MAG: PilC/PilY family type IV pilus protein [Gallionellaceae bacterium]
MNKLSRSSKFVTAAVLFGVMLNANSAITDLANAPLITSPTSSVLPNVFLMVDDSGSMAWDYMPDNANNFGAGTYGAASSQCNGVFYDPRITYAPPVDSTGASYSNSSFTAAWNDGYKTSSGTTNLSTSFRPTGGTAAPAYYYTYTGTQTTEKLKDYYNTSSTFYQECNTTASTGYTSTITITGSGSTSVTSITVNGTTITSGATSANSTKSTVASRIASAITATGYSATSSGSVVTITGPASAGGFTPVVADNGGGMAFAKTVFVASPFTKIVVSSTSGPGGTDERTNFANWWSYYHTRILMMKTATGKAFSSIGPTFRVGIASLNNNTNTYTTVNSSNTLLELAPFDTTQKANWYGKLYGVATGNSTPLREALADVGRMYANKLPATNTNSALTSSVVDPVQFSCQQNFTILTTDGFWNGSTTYKLDGSTVGNQDYFEPRAMYDGSNVVSLTTTPYTTVQQRQKVTTGVSTVKTWSETGTSIGGSCSISTTTTTLPTSCLQGNSSAGTRTWCMENSTALGRECTSSFGTGGLVYSCRGFGSATNLPGGVDQPCLTDSSGKKWCLFANNTTSGTSSCTSNGYDRYICSVTTTATITGSYVVTTPYTITETISGITTTAIDNYTADQHTTQTTTNGVAGAVSALTPATLTYNFTSNASTVNTGTASTVWGPLVAGTPTQVCTATASLPAPSVSTRTIVSTTTTAGTNVTTTLSTVGPTAGTPVTTASSTGGTSNTLADVAEYYYVTDLRTTALGNNLSGATGVVNGTDISNNNVPSSGLDAASHQHMTTFTLGLGARGRMVFDSAYESASTGDFYAVKQGSTANSTSGICTWQANNTICNWPTPASDAIENIDDLWHAAVNGRGTYFSAANPTGLATALSTALAGVSARTGSAAAATTSNAFVTQGDNFLFRSTFVSLQWTGELIRQQLDITTGAVLSTVDWSAQAQLDANAARTIYFYDASQTSKLSPFTFTNLTSTGLSSYFSWAYISSTASPVLSQLCAGAAAPCLPSWTANTAHAAGSIYKNGTTWYIVNTAYTSGATFGATDTSNTTASGVADTNLVNYIRGDRTYEGSSTDLTKFYRQRNHVMGDIVNSETTYVRGALSPYYSDPGYSSFITTVTDRQSMVYVGANDGMLHAFYAADGMVNTSTGKVVSTGGTTITGGKEAWAFIPTAVMPNLYKLADKAYSSNETYHRYFVDGSPVTADICISNCTDAASAVWKTILVGGLNGGGQGYYALDITNPTQPKALWEFTNTNLGYTYGNPKVVKLKDKTWAVIFTSGYNNSAGNGQGYLYVLNAYSGSLIRAIGTGVGSVATPSGLGKLDAPLVTPGVDSTALAVYAGDMLGNLWRFDINGDLGAIGYDAQLLATFQGTSGNVQPITTKPLVSMVGTMNIVLVGTGRYLGSTDLSDHNEQSFYALKDTALSDSPQVTTVTPSIALYGNPRTYSGTFGSFVHQALTSTTCPVGSSSAICSAGQSVVTSSNNAVSYSSNSGWYTDFPLAGERVNVDPAIIDRTLIVNTNVPNANSCSVGGDSFQYQFNYSSGGTVSSSASGVVAVKIGNEISTRAVIATVGSGSQSKNIAYTQGSGGGTPVSATVWSNSSGGNASTVNGSPSRRSWRQLIRQ